MKKIALLFSGQGAQTVGMGQDLVTAYPGVAELFVRADEVLEYSISDIAFTGPEEILTRTIHCQPALYVHGLACLRALGDEMEELTFSAAAGLSLGEFTAHAAAGTFDFDTGLRLVAQRASFMQAACESTSGAMAAMIGADENAVRDLAAQTDVDVANLNSPGQVVISGEASKVSLAVSLAREAGIRKATLLNVAGAYHSRLMKSAYEKLGAVLEETPIGIPRFPVVCNVDAEPVTDAARIRETLREQVTGTVRWTESIEYLIEREGIELFIELGPGKVLAGLVGRIRKDFPILSVSDVPSLKAAVDKLKAD
ncbi:MAG TPA: ACP S-malonyltransferase [Chthoniobacteraceae bacterium]|jgi:[acyl-carrier-protein] S-malonyltransferase|nr:ACP S-malonyltransferase [Chthoniobacteraceae bacterium]